MVTIRDLSPINRLHKSKHTIWIIAGLILLPIAVVGAQAIVATSFEAENGSISGDVSTITDTSASGGSAIRFDAPTPPNPSIVFPATISGRKMLDQNDKVYLMRSFSSWGMAQQLSNTEITTALEGVAANGFNAVTVFVGGGYSYGSGWNEYTNKAGQGFWTGTPWRSSLGTGWSTVDHIMNETTRLGLAVNVSFGSAYGDTGAGPEWESATNAQMYSTGVAIANRYASYSNIIWHIMFDDSHIPSSTRGQRINSLFSGINDTEGLTKRPIRWLEPNNGASIQSQGWLNTGNFKSSMNGWYQYGSNSTEIAENGFNESGTTSYPVGDTEPPYDGSPHYGGNMGQQLRERSYATFLEGGVYINYGHEDWWSFGAADLFDEGLTWQQVQSHSHTVQQKYVWQLIDQYVTDTSWAPTNSFVKTGQGSGDTKAAVGSANNTAIAYFPSSRSIVIDTTVLSGSTNVQLRWYDPTSGTYTTISASEVRNANRTISYPSAHSDGTNDWVLVVTKI